MTATLVLCLVLLVVSMALNVGLVRLCHYLYRRLAIAEQVTRIQGDSSS